MAAIKTINFLPEIFRTDTNKKFLNATFDQLLSEPNFKKVNGYIGRKFAPTYKTTDSYVTEADKSRENYQLEPSTIVINPETENIDFYSSYIDLINKIKFYGGNADNHSRLFSNETYSYNGKFDFDKFVNFSQYYWLANGPDPVTVSASGVPLEYTWDVKIDPTTGGYVFTSKAGSDNNPNLTLAYGGKYTFNVVDTEFWIQAAPGITGFDPNHPNINVRGVMGVENNGAQTGTVTFTVPQPNGQTRYTDMPIVQSVDYAVSTPYSAIQGMLEADIISQGLVDGAIAGLNGKKVIFIESIDDLLWTDSFTNTVVPKADRTKTWIIQVNQTTGVVSLSPADFVNTNEKIYVRSGIKNASRSYFIDYTGFYVEVPLITAPLTSLYYQNALSGLASGIISLVNPGQAVIDPVKDIIGKKSYISPGGVVFTNGLKVQFDSTAMDEYANNQFYVEGVGTGIVLVPVNDLVAPELDNLNTADYITISRRSLDLNAWSRSNRWFHHDVLLTTAEYNQTELVIDQNSRAARPIIEFDPDIKLFNYGKVAKPSIDILDFTVTSAYTQIENKSTDNATTLTVTIGGKTLTLTNGDLVIFANDNSPDVRSKIYQFKIVNISENIYVSQYIGIIVETTNGVIETGNNLIVKSGVNADQEFWFDGANWNRCQQKTTVNQPPMFDAFDKNGISYGDTSYYINSSFTGTKIFSYKQGTGTNDSILGFPLSYRTFNNVGDIQFENNWDVDTFTYLVSPTTKVKSINEGYLQKTISLSESTVENIWSKTVESSKQYQIISHIADGVNNLFEIDILPNPSASVPNVKVLVNSKFVDVNNFGLAQVGVRYAVLINPSLLQKGNSVDILIYSDSVSKQGYYQVPVNIDNNSLNQNFNLLTLGQLRNHLITLAKNSQSVTGLVPGDSNLRDINIKEQGGNILKHSAPIVYGSLFLVDQSMNFVEGVKFAQREYSKFKNKILELSTQTEIDINDIAGSLDKLITIINGVKNKTFAWYNSDMVPWGQNKTLLPAYTILDPRIRSYELSKIFDDKTLSNQAVLVYLTRTANGQTTTTLLVKDRDYKFNSDNPSFTILDTFNLNYDDVLQVVEYQDTDGNYIPETPTKLGLYPKYVPEIYVDNTYSTPTTVIQGHDGSITPAFGDFRDDLLLEFERRIYNNIKQEFSNDYLYNQCPGYFRVTDYSRDEFNQILSSNFLTWVGNNRLDYTTNKYFQSNNPWTWNYKNFKDRLTGEYLPGTWRAIYRHFFETTRPNTHPWEMLGFSDKPTWWEDRYGPAPYTGGNLVLWTDLSLGYIHAGPRAGVDKRFARPGLLQCIPVDESGNLLSPEKFIVLDFDSNKANASYAIGDCGPVEEAWRRSSDFPFALQIAQALSKPAYYFGALINVNSYKFNGVLNQYLVDSTNQHITPTDIEVNGYENANGTFTRTSGYINWVSDYLKNLGIGDPQSKIKNYLKNLNVQLSYKVAGFTDKRYINLLAEQGSPNSTSDSIVIPDDNYRIDLYKTVPINKIAYSAVIVEKSQNGYTVSGYNLSNPYFTIIPGLENNNAYTIKSGRATATIFKDYQKVKVRVPYGFEFTKAQDVVNFLVGYQRYLQSQGFIFTDYDSDLGEKQDWILSSREFLTWTQQGWAPGNVIILSPVNQNLKVKLTDSVVDEITNLPNGSKILDPNFNVIKHSDFTVVREDNNFSVATIKKQTIAFAELHQVQYEHVIVIDNKTSFNDIIYSPDTGNRQYRLKFIGSKTAGWTGALNPGGFIYNSSAVDEWQSGKDYKRGDLVSYKASYYVALDKVVATDLFDIKNWKQINQDRIKTGLLPNFASNAQKFENVYDLYDQPVDEGLNFYSNGITGFRERKYLTDLALDIETQSKFYQGYIKQKGTKNAILALAQAQLANISNEIAISEEWAVRVGQYGATDSDKYVEIELDEAVITNNPAPVEFIATEDTKTQGITQYFPVEVYQSSLNYSPTLFGAYEDSADRFKLPTAGYVHLDDIDATIFDMADYSNLTNVLNKIGTGFKIWAAKGFTGDWDVYRVSETECLVTAIDYSIDNIATFSTNQTHNLEVGDIVAVRRFDDRFDGFYQVYATPSLSKFSVALRQNYLILSQLISVAGSGVLFKLTSARLDVPSNIDALTPQYGWVQNDKVWVDKLDKKGNWGVYNKTSPWTSESKIFLNSSEYRGSDQFGQSLKLSKDGKIMIAGAPNSGTGRAAIFLLTTTGDWIENSNFVGTGTGTSGFGKVVEQSSKSFVIAAPSSNSNRGYVFIYSVDVANGINIAQVLTAPGGGNVGDQFGASVAISENGNWLYVGAPGAGKVYAFGWITASTSIQTLTGNGVTTTFTLNKSVSSATDILITTNQALIPNVDYTASGTTLTFTTAPASGTILVTYHSRYTLIDTWTQGNNFGCAVATNPAGDQIVVGANQATVNGVTQAGIGYVYDRMIEGFVANGINNTFIPVRNLGSTRRVTLNNVEQIEGVNYNVVGNNIQFITLPTAGSIIGIETNQFNLIQSCASKSATPGQQFGTTVGIAPNNNTLFFGAPSYSLPYYRSGAVYRFTNQGRRYGSIIGTKQNPTVTPGHSIRINTIEIQFTESSLAHVVTKINGAGIPGISARNNNGYIEIYSNRLYSYNNIGVLTTNNKLDVLPGLDLLPGQGLDLLPGTAANLTPGSGSAIGDLGLIIFVQSQTITHPSSNENEFFGTSLAISDTSGTLAVGSVGAKTINGTTFDSNTTTFDVGSITFRDPIGNSGAVYVFDLMDNPYETVDSPAQFAYVQQLQAPEIRDNFNFGAAIDIVGEYVAVSATNDSTVTTAGGSIYTFKNGTGQNGWDLIRYSETRAEPESIDKAYIYDKRSQNIVARLDYYDPAKGKLLGVAQQDLDFISDTDPAIYNDTANDQYANTDMRFDSSFHWTDLQVGKTWWDTSQMRYVHYDQGDILYRSKHWGEFVEGSKIKVYEWVESLYPPGDYVANGGDGIPKYSDGTAYVSYTIVDPATGLFKILYYFWVSDKTKVDYNKTRRTASISTIQQIIENPKEQGIPYLAPLKQNAINLYNIKEFLSGTDAVLHLDYSPATSTNIIHSEYQIVRENSDTLPLPDRIINKLQDSLAGIDMAGLVVPDPKLKPVQQVGIEIRPRQTMFIDRLAGLENFVKYINSVLILNPVARNRSLDALYQGTPTPPAGTGAWDLKIETKEELTYLAASALPNNYKVLVLSDSENDGLWGIYKWNSSTSTWSLVQIQSYATNLYWNFVDWYASDFDYTVKPTYTVDRYYQLEKLMLKAGDTIKLNDDGEGYFIYYRVKDDLSLEQVGVQSGTIQLKSSLYDLAGGNMAFDNDNFDTVRFDQNPNQEVRNIFDAIQNDIFIKDLNIEFNKMFFSIVNYIFSEQKTTDWIFKTSFISVLHKIRELIQYPSYVKDNQTFYEDYINEVKPYRTQIREYIPRYTGVDYLHTGASDFDLPPYYDETSGTFRGPDGTYTIDSQLMSKDVYTDWNKNHRYSVVEIAVAKGGTGFTLTPNVIVSGGDGQGVVAHATINTTYGNISSVSIVTPGSGFTTPPTITVNGNGTGAVLVPKLKNVFYTASPEDSYNIVRSFDTKIKFDRTSFTSNVVSWKANTAYTANIAVGSGTGNIWLAQGNLVSYNNQLYYPFNANVTTESTFDSSKYQLLNPSNVLIKNNERIMGYYQPGVGMPAKDLNILVNGIEYPGVKVLGAKYDDFTSNVNVGRGIAFFSANSSIVSTWANVSFIDLGYKINQQIKVLGSAKNDKTYGIVSLSANTMIVDTATIQNESAGANITLRYLDYNDINKFDNTIQSSYLDTALGTRPEDINIDGGAYVDTFSSHAPEEIIPGRVYDSLEMRVYTKISGDTITLGHRVFQNMRGEITYTRIATANIAVLSANLNLTDSNISVVNASLLPEPNPAQGHPGVVFINGEKITYYIRDTVNNKLGQIRRGVDGTGAKLVHVTGSTLQDASLQQNITGNVHYQTWLNMSGNLADGTGFNGSTTSQVTFLKASPAS